MKLLALAALLALVLPHPPERHAPETHVPQTHVRESHLPDRPAPDRVRLILLDAPARIPVPLRAHRALDDAADGPAGEALAREHGTRLVTADRHFWPAFCMELPAAAATAAAEALRAADPRPAQLIELGPLGGLRTRVLAPPGFAAPPYPRSPEAREVRQHVAFAGLAWEAAVQELARRGGFRLRGPIPAPRGSWSDLANASLDLADVTPLEALYLLALRNRLAIEVDGSGYQLK